MNYYHPHANIKEEKDTQHQQVNYGGFLYFIQLRTKTTKQVEFVSGGDGLLVTNRGFLTLPSTNKRKVISITDLPIPLSLSFHVGEDQALRVQLLDSQESNLLTVIDLTHSQYRDYVILTRPKMNFLVRIGAKSYLLGFHLVEQTPGVEKPQQQSVETPTQTKPTKEKKTLGWGKLRKLDRDEEFDSHTIVIEEETKEQQPREFSLEVFVDNHRVATLNNIDHFIPLSDIFPDDDKQHFSPFAGISTVKSNRNWAQLIVPPHSSSNFTITPLFLSI